MWLWEPGVGLAAIAATDSNKSDRRSALLSDAIRGDSEGSARRVLRFRPDTNSAEKLTRSGVLVLRPFTE
jgi:hypothetical protein